MTALALVIAAVLRALYVRRSNRQAAEKPTLEDIESLLEGYEETYDGLNDVIQAL